MGKNRSCVKQDAHDYEGDKKHQMWHIIDLTFHKHGIFQQIMAWVLNQNTEVALNRVNPRHSILHDKLRKNLNWSMTSNMTFELIEKPTPL